MDEHAIGLIHPGEMGAEVGACLLRAGARVHWAKGGRSAATATRARDTGLEETPDLAGLVAACGRIVSVCPPSAALSVARQVGDLGFQGVYGRPSPDGVPFATRVLV